MQFNISKAFVYGTPLDLVAVVSEKNNRDKVIYRRTTILTIICYRLGMAKLDLLIIVPKFMIYTIFITLKFVQDELM